MTMEWSARTTLLFLFGVLAFLYGLLFTPPFVPTYLLGDLAIYLLNAKRMFEGLFIYKDFFQFTLPGTELFYLALFKIFGVRIWIPNVTVVILGLGLAWVTLRVSRKILVGRAVLLPSILFLTVVYREYHDPSHHWFSLFFALAAVASVLDERDSASLALAGALCGLATLFTQIKGLGALLGLAIFLIWEHRQKKQKWQTLARQESCLFAAYALVLGTVCAYFAWRVGLKTFWFCTVEFGVKYYPTWWFNNFHVYMSGPDLEIGRPWLKSIPKAAMFLFIHALIPLVYVLFFVRYGREARLRPMVHWDRLMLVNMMGLFLFLAIAPAPSFTRLYAVSPPALIILIWILTPGPRYYRTLLWLLWVAGLSMAIAEPWYKQTRPRVYLDLPTGRVDVSTPSGTYEKLKWMRDHTKPGDFVYEAAWSECYFPLDLRDPAAVPFLTVTDYTRPEQVQEVVEALERNRVRFILFEWPFLALPTYPGGNHLGAFLEYMQHHYRVVKAFRTGEEVWERSSP